MKNQIIITGGLGFIGYHLVKKLISDKYYVIIIDNLSNANTNVLKSLPKSNYKLIKCDITSKDKIERELSKFNPKTIIHLAAIHYIPDCVKNPNKTISVNIEGTAVLLEIALKVGIKNFLFTSSAAVYKPSQLPHQESDPLKPIDAYGFSKKMAEEKIKLFCKREGIHFTILRLFNVYGPDDLTPHFIPSVLLKLKRSNTIRIGNLNTFRDYIYINDVIEIITRILKNQNKVNSTYNIGTGQKISGKNLVKIIEKIIGRKIILKKDGKLIRKDDRRYLTADITAISNTYSWRPNYTIRQGIKKLIKYYGLY